MKQVEVDEASLNALRRAVRDDDVGATEAAMASATDSFAPGGLAHERKVWSARRDVGRGIAHDETPYYEERYRGGAEYGGNLQDDNDDGRHIARTYTVFHHALHCNASNVAQWALRNGADPFMPSTWKRAVEDLEFEAALHQQRLQLLAAARRAAWTRRRWDVGALLLRHAALRSCGGGVLRRIAGFDDSF